MGAVHRHGLKHIEMGSSIAEKCESSRKQNRAPGSSSGEQDDS
jgi:hypothetical protein